VLNHGLMRNGGKSCPVAGVALENWFGLVVRVSRGGGGWFHKRLGKHITTPNKSHYLIGMPNFLAAASMIAFFSLS
jgi:hypothetical protein